MPPEKVKVRVNDRVVGVIANHLELRDPPRIVIRRHNEHATKGRYSTESNLITLNLNLNSWNGEGIGKIKRDLVFTILHEFRHAHQLEHWGAEQIARDMQLPYHERNVERDANWWAEEHTLKYLPLFDVKRRVSSRMKAQAAAERALT